MSQNNAEQKLDAVCITCKREKDQSPLTYRETVEYVYGKICEGIERGESLLSILETAVLDGIPLPNRDLLATELRRINQEQIDYYKSPSHKYQVCQKCRVFTDSDKFICMRCAGAEAPV